MHRAVVTPKQQFDICAETFALPAGRDVRACLSGWSAESKLALPARRSAYCGWRVVN